MRSALSSEAPSSPNVHPEIYSSWQKDIADNMSNPPYSKSSLCPTYVVLRLCSALLAHRFSQQRSSHRWRWGFHFRQRAQCACRCPSTGHGRHVLLLFRPVWRAGGKSVHTSCAPSNILSSGAFDTPKTKCPPDRGSSDWVTDSPASRFPYNNDSPSSSPPSSPSSFRLSSCSPRNIPSRITSAPSTPSLTPDSDSDDPIINGGPLISHVDHTDALDFLMAVFSRHGLSALPHSRSVTISAPNMGVEFNGVVVHVPGTPKTFYVDGKSAQSVNLRERYIYLSRVPDLASDLFR